MSPRLASILVLAVALAATLLAAPAQASHGDAVGAHFGLANSHNGPADPGLDVEAPAYPLAPGATVGNAWWAGTCDLRGASTANGGTGTPPATFAHCIDHGKLYSALCPDPCAPPRATIWEPGQEPGWRLDPATQAGSHPDAGATMWLQRYPDLIQAGAIFTFALPDGDARTILAELPPGVVGDPTAVPKCPSADLRAVPPTCAPETQIGVATITLGQPGAPPARASVYPVYNAEARDGKTAEFMLSPQGGVTRANVPIVAEARTGGARGDFGVDVAAIQIPGGIPFMGQTITLWGVPWAASHDVYRAPLAYDGHIDTADSFYNHGGMPETGLPDPQGEQPVSYQPSWGPIKPFLTNPTRCTAQPLVTTLELNSWQNPSDVKRYDAPADAVVDGCQDVPFEPDFSLEPANPTADAPSALEVELEVPQNEDPPPAVATNPDDATGAPAHWRSQAGLATAHLRDAVVTLPEGMAVNPVSASGLAACSSAEIGLLGSSFPDPAPVRFDESEPRCPDASKIGTVEVETPLLDERLSGDVYLAKQTDNPFGTLLGIYIVARSEQRGLLVKLAGRVDPDPQTGRLTTTFSDGPQLPFTRFSLRFRGGDHAPLLNPPECGTYETSWRLTAWTGKVVAGADPMTIDRGCAAAGFDPSMSAGTLQPVAGAFSPFRMRVQRRGSNQGELGRIDVRMPRGLVADLSDVPLCGEAELAAAAASSGAAAQSAPACPAGSQVGSTTVGAGGGTAGDLFYPRLPGTDRSGRVFLTGTHHGTQFPQPGRPRSAYGLAIEVPAVAGPFDLGNVVVRAAIYVDPETGQIEAIPDRLPRILQGVDLNVRDVRVDVDRPRFVVNPTSCRRQAVTAAIAPQNGATVERSARFQVGSCARLGLRPRMSMRLLGRRQTKLGGNPALRVVLRQGAGQSNLRNVKVTLPPGLALDARNAAGDWLCDFEDGQSGECPEASRIGSATAVSPLLKRPLRGPVYFVKHVRFDPRTGARIRTLPTLLMKLRGEVEIRVRATSDTTERGLLVSTISDAPDAAVSRFDLRIRGGARRGILAVSGEDANICRGRMVAKLGIRGHSDKVFRDRIAMKTPCTAKQRRAARRDRR